MVVVLVAAINEDIFIVVAVVMAMVIVLILAIAIAHLTHLWYSRPSNPSS